MSLRLPAQRGCCCWDMQVVNLGPASCRLDTLPDDVIVNIFSRLDTNTLRTARLLSKDLQRKANPCINLILVSGEDIDQQLQLLPENGHVHARLTSLRDAEALESCGCLPLVEALYVDNAQSLLTSAGGLFAAATKLTSLVLAGDISSPEVAKLDVLSSCTGLRSLKINAPFWCQSISLPTGLTRLHKLVLGNHVSASSSLLFSPSLRLLRGVSVSSETTLEAWAATWTALTSLGMSILYSGERGNLTPLSMLSSLEALDLRWVCWDGPLPHDLSPLASLTGLTSLRVGRAAPWAIIRHLPNLLHLRSLDLHLDGERQACQLSLLLGLNLEAFTHLGIASRRLGAENVAGVSAVLSRASRLESLSLAVGRGSVGGRLPNVLLALPRLTSLEVTRGVGQHCVSLPPGLVSQLSGLSSLCLPGCIVKEADLRDISGLSRLTRLRLYANQFVTRDGARCLGQLTNLEELEVRLFSPASLQKVVLGHPVSVFEAGFLDLQAKRREKGWRELTVWKDKVGEFTTTYWGLAEQQWNDKFGV